MGIKELLKSDKCITCGHKLEVLSWIKCQECSRKKTNKRIPKRGSLDTLVIKDYKDVLKLYKISHCFRNIDLSEKEYLVYDETGTIIGFRNKNGESIK